MIMHESHMKFLLSIGYHMSLNYIIKITRDQVFYFEIILTGDEYIPTNYKYRFNKRNDLMKEVN